MNKFDIPRAVDLTEPFLNLALYLQHEITSYYKQRREARANTFQVTVFCNREGHPVAWLEPEHSKIIPYAGGLERILEMCAEQNGRKNG